MANSYLEDDLIREQIKTEKYKGDLYQALLELALTARATLKQINIMLVRENQEEED